MVKPSQYFSHSHVLSTAWTNPIHGLGGTRYCRIFHIPLYPISNGPRKSSSFSTIAICSIPIQNQTSHQPQLLSLLIVIKKEPNNLLLPWVREKLCSLIVKVCCHVLFPDAHNPTHSWLMHRVVVNRFVLLGKGGFRDDCVIQNPLLP